MQGREEEVERQAPVGEVGEEGEGATRGDGEMVGVVPAEDGEGCDEGVEGEEEAKGGEDVGGKEPRGCEAGGWVEGVVDTEERVDFRH